MWSVTRAAASDWHQTTRPAIQILTGGEAILLERLSADEVADVALLKSTRTLSDVQVFPLVEATPLTPGSIWYSDGFPAFHDGVFRLSGSITWPGKMYALSPLLWPWPHRLCVLFGPGRRRGLAMYGTAHTPTGRLRQRFDSR